MTDQPATFAIGKHLIGAGSPCLIVAEAGVNHNGDLGLALELIRSAKEAGADAVKFQTFEADALVTADARKAAYQIVNTGGDASQLEMLRALQLKHDDFRLIAEHCREVGIEFLSTPYGVADVDVLTALDVAAFKVASAMIVEPSFLRHIAASRKPILLSTGMATHSEIAEAVEVIRATGNEQIVLLQCTTNYPASAESANLAAIATLRTAFGCHAGYSDHTPGNLTAAVSLAFGARVIEKHFTLDRSMAGPDHSSSCDPRQLADLVAEIRRSEAALGDGLLRPSDEELQNRQAMRRSVVAARNIDAGQIIGGESVTLKRPATGIEPRDIDRVAKCRARFDLPADTVLQWHMLDQVE